MFGVLARYMITTGMPRYENYPSAIKSKITGLPMGRASLRTDSLSWDDLRQLRQIWPRKLIVKGILHPQDAVLAADCGADAVVVSNHGGRNLDVTMAPIEVLPDILQALGGRIPVIVDSGFRRGSDVVKALALGADMVYVGRSTLYGVGAGGEAGATRAINIFREEIDRVMALIGCPDVAGLNSDYLVLPKNVKAPMAA
jgi:isopentenyl diphosphate isomerase/L-lactate dehydrogenase-like FMN-dependent dehydrogenase